jgi:hypothetical protein
MSGAVRPCARRRAISHRAASGRAHGATQRKVVLPTGSQAWPHRHAHSATSLTLHLQTPKMRAPTPGPRAPRAAVANGSARACSVRRARGGLRAVRLLGHVPCTLLSIPSFGPAHWRCSFMTRPAIGFLVTCLCQPRARLARPRRTPGQAGACRTRLLPARARRWPRPLRVSSCGAPKSCSSH